MLKFREYRAATCEMWRKLVRANPVAPLNIECFMDEKNARALIKREGLEKICVPILKHVKRPLEKAHSEAGLTFKVREFPQHWRPLYFNKASFFYLILLLVLLPKRIEARGEHLDSYLISMGIVILIAIAIIIVIASLCYCIRLCIREPPPDLEVELAPVQLRHLDAATFQTIFPEVPFQACEYDDTCGICRGMYTDGEILRRLPNCPHRYHHPCIESWLTTGNTTCPTCRHDYRDQLVPNPFPI